MHWDGQMLDWHLGCISVSHRSFLLRYLQRAKAAEVSAAASLLGLLIKHQGDQRQASIADAVPALIEALRSDAGAEDICRTLHRILESRPADQSEGLRIVAEGGVSALLDCLASQVSVLLACSYALLKKHHSGHPFGPRPLLSPPSCTSKHICMQIQVPMRAQDHTKARRQFPGSGCPKWTCKIFDLTKTLCPTESLVLGGRLADHSPTTSLHGSAESLCIWLCHFQPTPCLRHKPLPQGLV